MKQYRSDLRGQLSRHALGQFVSRSEAQELFSSAALAMKRSLQPRDAISDLSFVSAANPKDEPGTSALCAI